MEINYVKGDATSPIGEGVKVIIHICNNEGFWGKGFVLALSKKWDIAELYYRMWHKTGVFDFKPFELGQVQFVRVEPDLYVANLIGQKGIGFKHGPPIDYDAVRTCLNKVAKFCLWIPNSSVHGPRLGSGLAGGKWQIIEQIIKEELINSGIPVTIYDLD